MKMTSVIYLLLAALSSATTVWGQSDEGSDVFTPVNPPPMTPLKSHRTAAFTSAKKFQHGVNLGNYLESGRWGVKVSADEFAAMKREGFDHVRVPIGWQRYAGPAPDYTLAPEIFSRVDFVVTNALKNQLAVLLDLHNFSALDENPTNATPEFLQLWRQIAVHYQKSPKLLAFDLDNEPHQNATTELMNLIYAQVIAEIRRTNPKRTIFVEPGGWGSIHELKHLALPSDDNVIVSVHCYEPFHFTHQGASWVGEDFQQTGIIFPGPPPIPLAVNESLKPNPWVRRWIADYNTLPTEKNPSGAAAFASKLKYLHAWSDFYGRPVHLGEFGAIMKADEKSRANFYCSFRKTAENEKLGWCIWDWSANFSYWNHDQKVPQPGLHDALFGPSK